MNPMIQAGSAQLLCDRLGRAANLAELCAEFNRVIASLIPCDVALYVPVNSSGVPCLDNPQFKSNAECVLELANRLGRPGSSSAADEFPIVTMPIIAGTNIAG